MSETVQQHFVTFYSPGTFVAEASQRPIAAWDVEAACAMVADIKERYGAVPYGFRFSTRTRGPEDLDSKETAKSAMYYLGGIVETLEQVKARATEKDRILVANMEGNGYAKIVTNQNSWRWTAPLEPDDVVLDWSPAPPVLPGDAPQHNIVVTERADVEPTDNQTVGTWNTDTDARATIRPVPGDAPQGQE